MLGRTVDECARIAVAGGGMRLDAHFHPPSDLVRIAVAASGPKARITIVNARSLVIDDILRIAVAGKGCVEFSD